MDVFLPLNIRMEGKKILFVGGGSVALRKIRTIEQFTRGITILAPEINEELRGRGFTERYKSYESGDLEGYFLVYASTNDHEVNRRIRDDAERLGILVNVVDNRELSTFISPAILSRDDMVVAISSNGRNVKKSVVCRNRIRELMEKMERFPAREG